MPTGLQAVLPALLGFLITCALLGRGLESRPELRLLPGSVEAEKMREFRLHQDEYDLVYVGTSRVHRGFDPAAFDARLAELGRPVRSFNFGLVGLGFLEQRYLVEWILAQHPARLRWMLVDPTDVDVVMHRANLFTMRDVAWHTPTLTAEGVRAAWLSDRPRAEKVELTRLHVLHALKRLVNLGTGAAQLALWIGGVEEASLGAHGFGGVDTSTSVRDPEARAAREPALVWPSPVLWQTLRALPERVSAQGVSFRFVIPPTPRPLNAFRKAEARGDLAELLAYEADDLPEVFAEREQTFYDASHLNRHGARLFSRRLAADLAPWLD
jgi:hypothetical protein